ncbi:MAG: hypothetical protein H6732_05715 [Alphaproteobacteria bacterium]|nr:hypothetical protein [Alphaproteobacteria bacterium]
MRPSSLLPVVALAALACASGDPDVTDTDTDTDADSDVLDTQDTAAAPDLRALVVGTWVPDDPGLFFFGEQGQLSSLVLRPDGSGGVTWTASGTGALVCLAFRWEVVAQSLLLDFEASELAVFLFDGLYGLTVDEDRLALVPDVGLPATFDAAPALPPEQTCGRLIAQAEVQGPSEPHEAGNLVYAPTVDLFWYAREQDASVEPVNPSGAAISTPPQAFPVSMLRGLQAVDLAADAWWFLDPSDPAALTCRTSADASCGKVDTTTLGAKITVEAAALAGGHLWLHGRSTTGPRQLVEVDLAGPTLVRTVTLDLPLEVMTWDGTHLWGVSREMVGPVLQIDPGAGRVVRTWGFPAYNRLLHRWEGLAFAGGELWAMMTSSFDEHSRPTLRRFARE